MNHRTPKSLTALIVALGLVAIAAAPHYRKTRPQVRCTIPNRDYQYKELSQPKRSVSAVAIPIRDPVPPVNGKSQRRAIQAFQFVDNPVLQIDHCRLSKMSVLLHETGAWTVSFQADQNPVDVETIRDVTTAEEQVKITSHILRNQFHVHVTCYGRYGTSSDSQLGKAVIIPFDLKPFWTQKGVPLPYYATGHDIRIADNFDILDRVEIEFAYHVD